MARTPLWRQVYDAVEKRAAGQLEAAVRTEAFAVGVGLIVRLRKDVRDNAPIYLAGVGPPWPDGAGEPRRARNGSAATRRSHAKHSMQLGQAWRGRLPTDARRWGQRPRRHVDGGNHQPNGRFAARLPEVGAGTGSDRGRSRPAGTAANDHLRAHRMPTLSLGLLARGSGRHPPRDRADPRISDEASRDAPRRRRWSG